MGNESSRRPEVTRQRRGTRDGKGYKVWYRHSGEKAIEKIPLRPDVRTVSSVGAILYDVGDHYITHLYIEGRLPDLGTLAPQVQQLEIKHLANPEMLNSLPSLTQLEVLGLSYNDFSAGIPEAFSQLSSLKDLKLQGCTLSSRTPGWSNLPSLTQLEVLNISANDFSAGIPEVIAQLRSLKKLLLDCCKISSRTPGWSNLPSLTQLEVLGLSGNGFSAGIPEAIARLSSLKDLDLEGCTLSSRTPGWSNLPSLTQLEVLDLSENNFSAGIPEVIAQLSSLKVLKLRDCTRSSRTPGWSNLSSLTQLEVLNISANDFSAGIPEAVSQLSSLKRLLLYLCKISSRTPGWSNLPSLTQLEVLDLSQNDFSAGIPEAFSQLSSLKVLKLRDCTRSSRTPGWSNFSNLERLEELDISSNKFQELPAAVYQLRNLHTLNISRNSSLQSISAEILQLGNLKSLDCEGCYNLQSPPFGVCMQGLPAIRQYFIDLAVDPAVEVTIAPIAVLGDTMGGKTSLIRSLQAGERMLTHREEASPRDEATKVFKMEDLKLKDSELRFIDFGGQRIYHIAYQLTLKEKCLPLVVVNMKEFSDITSERESKEATRRLCFDWIAHIYLSCPRLGAPILVMTHKDQLPDEKFNLHKDQLIRDIEEIRQQVLEEEKALYEDTSEFCQIVHLADTSIPVFAEEDIFVFSNDLTEHSNIQTLLGNLEQRCKDFKETIPALWERVTRFIKEQADIPYMLVSDIKKEFPDGDVQIILRYMHNIGKILFYENIKNLSEYIFHQIDSITQMLCLLFDHTGDAAWRQRVSTFSAFKHCDDVIEKQEYEQMIGIFLTTGFMDEAILFHVLKRETKFPPDLALTLLHSFFLIHGPVKQAPRDAYIIPHFSKHYFDRSWKSDGYLQLRADIKFNGLRLPEYAYQLMTVGVLNCDHKLTHGIRVFKNGTTIRHGRTSTHLVHDYNNDTVFIQISTTPEHVGPSWERLVNLVRYILDEITVLFKSTRPVCRSYCSHCLFLREPNPDIQVNPVWFRRRSHVDSSELCSITTFSGTEPVSCCNTESDELTVLKPLRFPCYELSSVEISELKDYLSLVERHRHVPAKVVDVTNQPESGADGCENTCTAQSPAEYEESDLSDVEEEGYTDDSGPKVMPHRLKATSHHRIKALYDNPKVYQMSDGVRGRVLIFNIKIFRNNGELCDNRRGSEVDYSNLSRLFTAMKFDVVKSEKELTDLTAEQIFSEIKEETALPAHSSLGMFVLVIMTNGSRENILFDCDYQPLDLVKIKDLLSPAHFPALKGKPKLLIVQACSGGRVDLGNMDTYFPAQSVAGTASVPLEPITLHVDDFYVMKASSESYIATRSPSHGSWFIRVLVATFYKHACHRDVESLFKIIQDRVRQVGIAFTTRMKKSMKPSGANVPISYCTFTNYRKLYFFPRYSGSPPEKSSTDE